MKCPNVPIQFVNKWFNIIHLLTQQIDIGNLAVSWGYDMRTTEMIPGLPTRDYRREKHKKENHAVSVQLHLRRAKVQRSDVV